MENKLKHLEFIQTVINRMAGNCFMLKGLGDYFGGCSICAFSERRKPQLYFYCLFSGSHFLDFERLFFITRKII